MYKCTCGTRFEYPEFSIEDTGNFPYCPECGASDDSYEEEFIYDGFTLSQLEDSFEPEEGLEYLVQISSKDTITHLGYIVYGKELEEPNTSNEQAIELTKRFLLDLFKIRINEYNFSQSEKDAILEHLKDVCLGEEGDWTDYAAFISKKKEQVPGKMKDQKVAS